MTYSRIGLALLSFVAVVFVTTFTSAEQKVKKGAALPPFPDAGSQGKPGMNDLASAMETDPQGTEKTMEEEIMGKI